MLSLAKKTNSNGVTVEMKFFFIILLLSLSTKWAYSWEYCNLKGVYKGHFGERLCAPGIEHSFCNPKVRFEGKGIFYSESLAPFLPATNKFKRFILETHNYYRNIVAGGEATSLAAGSYYPKAGRMRELLWDDELAYGAKLHLTAAKMMDHDECRSTQRYLLAGQNLGTSSGEYKLTVIEAITGHLKAMYNEKDLISDTANFPDNLTSANVQKAGHFTQMVGDRNSRIGCAYTIGLNCSRLANNQGPWFPRCYYLACHYDFSNVSRWRLYKKHATTAGAFCSDWHVGKSKDPRYPNLCEATPNELFSYTDKNG
uniref:SCP domain-containing protein n=1 Tax=Glossina brevipalpis TaxID=37001 RepID=A0A1A9X481_9MUSC